MKQEILENHSFSVRDTLGIWSVVFAVIGLLLYPIPLLDVAISITAVVTGVRGIRSPRERFRGVAIVGTLMGVLGIISGMFVSLGLVT